MEITNCCVCGNKALYTAQFKGYCSEHKAEAAKAMQTVNRKQENRNWGMRRQRAIAFGRA